MRKDKATRDEIQKNNTGRLNNFYKQKVVHLFLHLNKRGSATFAKNILKFLNNELANLKNLFNLFGETSFLLENCSHMEEYKSRTSNSSKSFNSDEINSVRKYSGSRSIQISHWAYQH